MLRSTFWMSSYILDLCTYLITVERLKWDIAWYVCWISGRIVCEVSWLLHHEISFLVSDPELRSFSRLCLWGAVYSVTDDYSISLWRNRIFCRGQTHVRTAFLSIHPWYCSNFVTLWSSCIRLQLCQVLLQYANLHSVAFAAAFARSLTSPWRCC